MGVHGPWDRGWKTLGTNIRVELHEQVKAAAAAQGKSPGTWLRDVVQEKLQTENREREDA